ncbi:MAG: ribosomal protection-like ABC-F family protein [Candidatus Eremiobacterota bacterium]
MILQLKSVTKYIGARKLLSDISFIINKGQRAGLTGRNGCGKSTLFKLISGEEKPDRGEIITGNIRTGYLPQGFSELHSRPDITVKDFLFEPVKPYTEKLYRLEKIMENPGFGEGLEDILADYEKTMSDFESLGGYLYGETLCHIFEKLNIDSHITPECNIKFLDLSGGQKIKVALAGILAGKPDLLLLDEPTNYLDLKSLLWLEEFLLGFPGSLLFVSHDRKFLDTVATDIFNISIPDGTLKTCRGNYSFYVREQEKEREKHREKYNEQQAKIAAIKADISNTKGYAIKTELSTIHFYPRSKARKVARKAVVRERKLEKMLSEENRIDKPWELENVRIKLADDIKKGKSLFTVRDAAFSLPDGRTLFSGANMELSCGEKIAITGQNGSGKSTLMKIIAGKIKNFSGEVIIWPGTVPGYLPQDETETLTMERTVIEEFRSSVNMEEGEARTYLHRMLFKGEDVFKQVGDLSYGERIKLVLVKLMASGVNTILLDEPTSHMDIDSMERLEDALCEFTGGLLVITHDRYFMEKLGIKKIYIMEKGFLRVKSEK